MADTTTSSRLRVQQWDDKFFTEYVRENRFAPDMGTSENSIVQVKEDLRKRRGDRITFNLVNRLTGAGVTGTSTMEGNEESVDQRAHLLTVDKVRNAVRVAEMEEIKNAIDIREAGRMVLKTWIMEKTRDDIIAALGSIQTGHGTFELYGDASEAEKDAFLADNSDRYLFGAAKSNNSANDHSAALANIDSTNDKLTASALSLMKRIAKTASPKIRPIKTMGDEEWFKVYVPTLCLRDLVNSDSAFQQANREARERSKSNPLFRGADYVWDGLIIKEIPEIEVISGVGASSIDVAPVYLCGAQALGVGWAKRTTSRTKEFDYGDKYGMEIHEIRGIEKLCFEKNGDASGDFVQHGVVTGFFSAVADS